MLEVEQNPVQATASCHHAMTVSAELGYSGVRRFAELLEVAMVELMDAIVP